MFKKFVHIFFFFCEVAYSLLTSSAGWSGFDFRQRQKSFCSPKRPNRCRILRSVLSNGTADFSPVTATIHLALALESRTSGVITYLHSFVRIHVVSKHRDNFYCCVLDQAVFLRLFTAEACVRCPKSSYGPCGGQSDTGTGFLHVLRFCPCSYESSYAPYLPSALCCLCFDSVSE